jgi:diguanylate cyclase (GGDEF)-like protein
VQTDRQLSDLLSEFARTLVTNFPIQSILDHLVVRIAEVLPISSAAASLISEAGESRGIASSDESAYGFVNLQSELGQGPCLDAHRTGEVIVVPDLGDDERFPLFSERGLAEGLRAVVSIPLMNDQEIFGALDLYRTEPGAMDENAMYIAQTLADVATAYLLNARTRESLEESSERAFHISLHDSLTGLPNPHMFIQRLDHAIVRGRRSEKILTIIFADLDQLRKVNDTFGHHVGDELLVAVVDRLTGLLRPGDTLARLSGGKFLILCEDLDEVSQGEALADRMSDALAEPFVVAGSVLRVGARVGLVFTGVADHVPGSVLKKPRPPWTRRVGPVEPATLCSTAAIIALPTIWLVSAATCAGRCDVTSSDSSISRSSGLEVGTWSELRHCCAGLTRLTGRSSQRRWFRSQSSQD